MQANMIDTLNQLFTVGFTLDEDLVISDVTPSTEKLLPNGEGRKLLEVFKCQRPATLSCYQDLVDGDQSLFLLIGLESELALKGQLIPLDDSSSYRFIGVPWLAWINENAPDVTLGLQDFPKLDSQMDQQFYITGQQNMVRDLEELNHKLSKAEQEAKEANRLQSELFAVMSHEMRTPLNGVISALTLLNDEKNPYEKDNLLTVAQESANSLLNVINYTLDFSKVEAGKLEVEIEEFYMEDIVNSVRAITAARARENDLELKISMQLDRNRKLLSDAEKISQILVNLVGNAIKYTDVGEVELSISVDDIVANKARLNVEVRDTGVGISAEDLPHIYEPFWGKRRGKRDGSTGLGLSIVKRVIESMSGDINVSSVEGEGTLVSVALPIDLSESDSERIAPVQSLDETLDARLKGDVLLVDDNQTNLLLGKMILEKFGVRVRTALNGVEATSIAREMSFDLILMDISMPEMDGVEATMRINKLPNPPPIVALTAYVGDEKVKSFMRSGFQGCLAKPIEPATLFAEMSRWLPIQAEPETASSLALNAKVIELLVQQIGEDNFVTVRNLFVDESQKMIGDLLGAWVARDLEAIRKVAHTLASSVASFGCDDLANRLRSIEKAAKKNSTTEIIPMIADLDQEYQKTISELVEFDYSICC